MGPEAARGQWSLCSRPDLIEVSCAPCPTCLYPRQSSGVHQVLATSVHKSRLFFSSSRQLKVEVGLGATWNSSNFPWVHICYLPS